MPKARATDDSQKKWLDMLESFKKLRILVVGDVMLDEYAWGSATRISPEAPVPVVVVKERTFNAGGAANTVANIMSLGAKADLMGVAGRDPNGNILKGILAKKGIDTKNLAIDPSRPTTSKVRIIAQGQQVMRADQEFTGAVNESVTSKMLRRIERMIAEVDGIAISDYDKGVIRPKLMSGLINLAKQHGKIVAADLKPKNAEWFRGVSILTPNRMEATQLSGIEITDKKSLFDAGQAIRDRLNAASVLITLGEGGMALITDSSEMLMIPAMSTQVYDVTGAGDTVLSVVALGLSGGHSVSDSVRLANYAAGVVVRKRGTTAVDAGELSDFIRRKASS
ncbi:MAG TPA: D-glycero-beta-D-manno-heptose-7-phosphate kinase [bacterium]|nr:D-glycero-beta-D-manno-heptose-7-phosphate kinase [bacterium]